jgi:DNA-binding transcriptional LysR family regulator
MSIDLWPGLELRHVAAFQAVAEVGSFARAAEQLSYTQPAVSQQIASLERIVGHRLLDRSSGRSTVELTEAGRLLLGHLDAIEARLGAARSDLDALRSGSGGTLHIGAFQSVSARILPDLLRRLALTTPGITIDLFEANTDEELLERLDDGVLDFAFVMLPVESEKFETVELLRDPYYLVARSGDGERAPIESLEDLRDVSLIGHRTCRSTEAVEATMRAAGIEPRYAFRSDDNTAVKGFVESGLGIAVVPRLALDTMGSEGVETQCIDGLVPARLIGLAWSCHRSLKAAQEVFVAAARETCETLREDPTVSRR